MDTAISFLFDNKEWLFSGGGLVLLAWVYRVFFKKKQTASTQSIRSGDGSTNIQSGRDVNIGKQVKKSDWEEK